MPLLFNLRHLEHQDLTLEGELPVAELDLDGMDELIRVNRPVWHRLEVERHEQSVLVHGSLKLSLQCECARCLKAFEQRLEFPDWTCHLPLEGEDRVLIVNDCVDLTPYIREDILLAFPQHPLCESECCGLPAVPAGANQSSGASQTKAEEYR